MRVLVCGGRGFNSPAQTARAMDRLHAKFTALIQGGADGTDRLVKEWARTKPEIVVWSQTESPALESRWH